MEILTSNSAFNTIDGEFQYVNRLLVVCQDNKLYTAKWPDRFNDPTDFSQLSDPQRIETEDRGPEIQKEWTRAPVELTASEDVYVKKPSLVRLATEDLEYPIRREIEALEILRKHPHPNIGVYHGYLEARGRVTGLCLERYKATLYERVDPGHLKKNAFRKSGRELVDEEIKASLDGILAGIKHLHSLGLVHNDITPSNIMYDEDGAVVLVDFDSCRRIGEDLRETNAGRTFEWHDESVETSLVENDLDAFAEIKTWLVGSSDDEFVFKRQ